MNASIPQKGIMTLTLLILLSSLLLLLMLFDDDVLRIHSSLAAQRKIYAETMTGLQQQSVREKVSRCQSVPLQQSGNVALIEFQQHHFQDGVHQLAYCERVALFKKAPNKHSVAGGFEEFIDRQNIAKFAPHFIQPMNGAQSTKEQIYWFHEPDARWEISSAVNGIVIAEGNLHISGKGKISGSIITAGTLSGENITWSYSKTIVTKLVQDLSEWQSAEKSWHDFKAL